MVSSRQRPALPAAAAAALLLAACGTGERFFRPTEPGLTETPGGMPAAVYEVRVGTERWGQVRVWSDGAEVHSRADRPTGVLHVGLEVRNALAASLELDLARTRLEAIDAGARAIDVLAPDRTAGDPRTAPHTVGHLDLEFALPEGVEPADLRAFRLHWWLHGPGEAVYEQYTSFVPLVRYRPYYWHDPWYFGAGYGFYWCY